MSRLARFLAAAGPVLVETLPPLAVAAACFGREKAEYGRVEEIRVLSEALDRERRRNSDLDKECHEARVERNEYMKLFAEQMTEFISLRNDFTALREEIEMAKKPPPMKPPGKGKPPMKPPGKKPKPC